MSETGPGSPPAPVARDVALAEAVPSLLELFVLVEQALVPAIAVERPSPAASAFWQIRRAAAMLLAAVSVEPAEPGDPWVGQGQPTVEAAVALRDAHAALQNAADDVRAGIAEHDDTEALAELEGEARLADLDLGNPVIEDAMLSVALPDEGSISGERRVRVVIHVTVGGVAWAGQDVPLPPVGRQAQLDVAEALRVLARALGPALP
jgi:hypothetical protein